MMELLGRMPKKKNVREIDTYPNMEYIESRSRVFSRKPDMATAGHSGHHVTGILSDKGRLGLSDKSKAVEARIVEEQVFGRDHLSWFSGSALAEAGVLADYLILRTRMTALGKFYYRTQQDLMIHLGSKVVALRDEYMRYAVEKCSSILKEHRSALETLAERLLDFFFLYKHSDFIIITSMRNSVIQAYGLNNQHILQAAEGHNVQLPFSCRQGCCTSCAVRVRSGQLYQREALGISSTLKEKGYGLLCVGYALSDLELETQDEDEVKDDYALVLFIEDKLCTKFQHS